MSAITRYTAVGLAALQSTAYYFYIRAQGYLTGDANGAAYTGFWAVFQAIVIILCYTAGASLLMWLGEQINEKGIGNGISIILFAVSSRACPPPFTTCIPMWTAAARISRLSRSRSSPCF